MSRRSSDGGGMVINTLHASSNRDIIRMCVHKNVGDGWTEEKHDNAKGDVIFSTPDAPTYRSIVSRLRRHQRLSRLPCMQRLCFKVPFATAMQQFQRAYPDLWSTFWPETWVLPGDQQVLLSLPRKGTLILKPSDGAQGTGIVIVQTQAELEKACSKLKRAVVQRVSMS